MISSSQRYAAHALRLGKGTFQTSVRPMLNSPGPLNGWQAPAQLASSIGTPSAVQRTGGSGGARALEVNGGEAHQQPDEESGDGKYQKRQSTLQRTLKPMFPALFSSSNGRLPVTTKYDALVALGVVVAGIIFSGNQK